VPTYEYECPKCNHTFEIILRMAESDTPQKCPNCKTVGTRVITGGAGFILKGDSWAGKNGRVAQQMKRKNRRLDAKQAERKQEAPGLTLAPNVEGERVDSWSEVQKLAKSKGKETTSYEPKIREERVR